MASWHKRKRSPFLWVSYIDLGGKQKWKNTKLRHDQVEQAEALCREIEAELRLAKPNSSALTVRAWAEKWFEARDAKIKSMKDDKSRVKKHILPGIGSIELRRLRKADVQAVFDGLRAQYEATGKPASGTIKSIYAACKVMFNDAVAADLIPASPLFLSSKTLPSVHKRARLPYTLAEIEKIIMAPPEVIPDDRRTLYAVLFFFGLRFGEGAALKWADFYEDREPLAGMDVSKSWSNSRKSVGKTKTETARPAPVHLVLFFLLQEWKEVGFPSLFGRAPEPDDLLVPSREGRCRSSNHGMKKLRQDLKRLGFESLELRTQHAFRTTFISQMRAAKVDKDKVRAVTHGKRSSGDVIDAFYTVWPWEVLCDAVKQLPFSEKLLHFIETVVSTRSQREKWRGGRDSNSCEMRYMALLAAQLLAFTASKSNGGSTGVNDNFTLSTPVPTSLFTLEEGGVITLEPLSLAEIVAGLPWASQVIEPAQERQASTLPRSTTADHWAPLRSVIAVTCEACGRAAEVEDGPGIWECIFCSSNKVRVGV